jgi:hypothetical protein
MAAFSLRDARLYLMRYERTSLHSNLTELLLDHDPAVQVSDLVTSSGTERIPLLQQGPNRLRDLLARPMAEWTPQSYQARSRIMDAIAEITVS